MVAKAGLGYNSNHNYVLPKPQEVNTLAYGLLIQASHEYCAISSGVYRYGFDEDKTVDKSKD